MVSHICQIAKLITEHPDIIRQHNILLEDIIKDIKKFLTKISNKLPYKIDIDEITQFATQQRFKELEISRWIAKQVAFNPNLRVDWSLLTDYIAHLKFRDNNKYKALFKSKIQEVAKDAEEWHSSANNEVMIDNEPIITEFPNGYRIVKLTTKEHCETEGELMDNCVKKYDPKETDLYSLRSPDGKPKVTIQILKDGRVNELKGRQNKPPVKKYADLVIPWVNSILNDPEKLFIDPSANFTDTGFEDYVGSLSDEGLLLRFAKSKDINIRIKVASNPNTPPDVLRFLFYNNANISIRVSVAKNPSTPVDLLQELVDNQSVSIKMGVAGNPSTPAHVLRLLSDDEHYCVRNVVASNPNVSIDILKLLAKDDNTKLRVVRNPKVPIDILKMFIVNNDIEVLDYMAGSEVPIDILRSLAKHSNYQIRLKVAWNYKTPLDVLESLKHDPIEVVRDAASYHLTQLTQD